MQNISLFCETVHTPKGTPKVFGQVAAKDLFPLDFLVNLVDREVIRDR